MRIKRSKNSHNHEYLYAMSIREYILYYAMGICFIMMIGVLFYNRVIAGILLSPLSYYFVKERKKELQEARKIQLSIQFKDAIYSISTALNAGYSVELAIREAIKDLRFIYLNPDAPILKEFSYMISQIEMNIPIETIFYEFAKRTQIDDIENFADIFATCKRTGGDVNKVIRTTSKIISEKIEIKREIHILMAQKKFEQKIMSCIPFGIILYLWLTSPGFLDIMYHSVLGNLVMSGCLIGYYLSYRLSKRIMSIEI